MTDHPEYLGLVADVIANPADDGPRLILADWLGEHGDDDRADFIRRHVAAWHEHGAAADVALAWTNWDGAMVSRWSDAQDWWRCIAQQCASVHSRVVVDASYQSIYGFIYRRGFPRLVRLRFPSQWVWYGPSLVREHPIEDIESDTSMVMSLPKIIQRSLDRNTRPDRPVVPAPDAADSHGRLATVRQAMLWWARLPEGER